MLTTVNELYIPLLQEDPRVRVSGVGVGCLSQIHLRRRGGWELPSESCSARKWRKSVNVNSQHFILQRVPAKPTVQIRVCLCSFTVTEAGVLVGGLHDSQGEFDKFIDGGLYRSLMGAA